MDNKYQTGKIYKILSPSTNKMMIACTYKSLEQEMKTLKNVYNRRINNAVLKNQLTPKQKIYGCGDCVMVLIEDYPCRTNHELTERKKYHIKNLII